MRIALVGAQSTGKTTLFLELQKNKKLSKKFKFLGSFIRELKKKRGGLSDNSESLQNEIIKMHIDNLNTDNVIMDRCLLDSVVYTRYYASHGVVSAKCVLDSYRALLKYRNKLDIVFYLRPEFGVVEDGERSSSVEFQKEISNLFDKFIKYMPNVIEISGTVDERISKIISTLKKYKIDC